MTINTRRSSRRRLAGLLGLVLALQPAASLAAIGTESAVTPSSIEDIHLAQRRGGGSGSRSSSRGSRSSSRSSSRSGGRTGFSNYSGSHSGSRSSSRQSTRQTTLSNRQGQARTNSSNRQGNRQSNRSDRQDQVRNNSANRQNNRTDRVNSRQNNRTDRVNTRSDTRRDAINNWDRFGNGWYSGNNWYNNRPWNSGWYGGSYYNNWGWYPGRAAAWGVATMATFGVINSLVNTAQSNEVSYIVVPDSEYSLYYPSVTATGDTVTFEADDGDSTARFYADCRQGTINGGTPNNGNEAQLLNAACQVAFGG
ncbi:hypothetical protein SynMITS9220_00826 [Synechococcus sp. MIT S9220]|uniref:hypothetical protein n=1 Tax=unclassified Synechococcus TaxID=2626047 RepID=UPI00164BC81E|nr:hypothetical protein [Synechococcus sp. MIT S9220]NOL47500.1 hypothetical protein [Synechococcus sp. MIT S9220]QNJ22132.1 hypothetical protein SynMITS9220_00826 [Synechococcus sp. MIT S9220]